MYKVYKQVENDLMLSTDPQFIVMGSKFYDEDTRKMRFDCVDIGRDGSLESAWPDHDYVVDYMDYNYELVFFGTLTECREYVEKAMITS